MSRRLNWIAAAIGIVLGPVAACAQLANFPNQPVHIISDSAPGSTPDISLRLLAEELGRIWGQQVITINQPGAGGAIAARAAAAAAPDGYTLFMPASSTFLQIKGMPGVADGLPLELPRDFLPVGFVTLLPMFIGVSHTLGVNSVGELIDLARRKPNDIAYATTGRGRFTHLTMELLQQRAGIQLRLVTYAGGPAAAMPDVVSGRVAIVIEGYSGVASAMQGNIIQSLAVASPERLPGFENLATVAETLPGFSANGWSILVAPRGVSDAIVNKISADLNKALESRELNAKYNALGAFTRHMSPEQVTAFTRSEQAAWRPILEKVARESP